MKKIGRFLATVGEQSPTVLCEKHAQVFELTMSVNDIPHTIYEFDDETESQHCQACDLKVAKEYIKKHEESHVNHSRIILPGEYI